MFQLNYPVPGTCTRSTFLCQGHVPAQLSCTRDMYQYNYPVPGTCTSSTILYQGHAPTQLSCTRNMFQLNYPVPGTCNSSTILYQRYVPAQLSCTRDMYQLNNLVPVLSTAQPPTLAGGQAQLFTSGNKLTLSSRDKYCTIYVHVIYPILHGSKYSLTIHFMGQVQPCYLILHGGQVQLNYQLLRQVQLSNPPLHLGRVQLNYTSGDKYSSATLYCMRNKYSSTTHFSEQA